MKKSYVLITLIVISFAICCLIRTNDFQENKNIVPKISFAYVDNNDEKLNFAFKETFGKDFKDKIQKNIEITNISNNIDKKFFDIKKNQIDYPNNFGGKYINEDNKLVIQITKGSDITNITSDTDNTIIEYVDNSYAKLEKINNEIINYFTSNVSSNDIIITNYIDVINNKVIVELPTNSTEEQNWFKNNILNSNLIEFIKNENTLVTTSSYNSGGSFGGFCTIGYRAKLNGVEGFVTAGHCVDDYSIGTLIGNYGKIQKITTSGSFDAAFISLSSNNSVSNTLSNAAAYTISLNTTAYTTYTVGTLIAKSGITTGATTGSITNTNYSTNATGNYISNLVLTTAQCNNGDSGGPVYRPGTASNSTGTIVGIVHGKVVPTDNTSANGSMIFSKSSLINSSYGLVRY